MFFRQLRINSVPSPARWPLPFLAALLILLLAAALLWAAAGPAGAQDGYQPDQQVVDDVWSYARETDNGFTHVLRWMQVLHTLGALEDMSAAEARDNAGQFWAARWDPVADELAALEAQDDYVPDSQVVDDVWSYARETDNGFTHVLRWMRVLSTLGAIEAMTAAEARGYAEQYLAARWNPVADELAALEAAASEPAPTATPEPTPEPTPVPNQAPVVNTQAKRYASFTGNSNAPRGVLVWKRFQGIFSDPDGDDLTYSVAVTQGRTELVQDLDVRPAVLLSNGERADMLFLIADADGWKSLTSSLPNPQVITVTLTATDPGGLSASVSGDFSIEWGLYPEVVSARADGAAIELTFDWAVEANPAPKPWQFTVNVVNEDGSIGTITVERVSVNGKVVTLELASALDGSQTVTLDYNGYNYLRGTPLQRAGGGDAAPSFSGQAVEIPRPPGEPRNLALTAEAGSLDISAAWHLAEGVTFYNLAWRQAGGDFVAGNAATVSNTGVPDGITGIGMTFTVSEPGQWEVRLQACNEDGCGPSVSRQVEVEAPPEPGELQVAITASPANPRAGERVTLRAVISNAPSGSRLSYYIWQTFENGELRGEAMLRQSTINEYNDKRGSLTFRVTASYDTGDWATSDPITVTWARRFPNRPPLAPRGGLHSFANEQTNASRGSPVSKTFEGLFYDPDGDKLTYTVTVPDEQKNLVETLGAYEATYRVGLEIDADDDWKAISPALPDPLTITVTLTATDTDALSASVSGDFITDWESHPALLSATASEQAIELTFDLEVQKNPAPGPGQFTVNVVNEDGSEGTVTVSSVWVNGAVVTLELASALVIGQRVTLDYAHDDDAPLKRAADGGDPAPDFAGQAVKSSLAASSSSPVCDRTPQIRDAIMNMIADASNCAEVTDEQLAAITGDLRLRDKGISVLQAGDFNGLTSLNVLDLQHNLLKSLPQGVFDGLAGMNRLRLNNNQLTELSSDVFTGLTGLENLHLGNNKLATVPATLLASNANLVFMSLYNNGLTELPAGLFDGLTSLKELDLRQNRLTTLPAGLFADLTAISTLRLDDAVNPRLCERSQGEQDSILEQLPDISDCRLVTDGDVTLALATMPSSPLCERTPRVRDAILNMIPDVSDCADVTDVHLAAITGTLNLASQGVSTLRVGDFDGLSSLEALDLQDNTLTSLPKGSFKDLGMARWVRLNDNQLATLDRDTFSGMDTLHGISLHNNRLTSIPAGAFEGLSALRTLHLHGNELNPPAAGAAASNNPNPLPAGLFADLTAIRTLTRDRAVDPLLCEQSQEVRDDYLQRLPDINNCQLVTWEDISQAARQRIEEEYILPYQYDYPWLHEAWFDVPVKVHVARYPGYAGWYWYGSLGFSFGFERGRGLVYHELTHHYTVDPSIHADDPTAKLSMLSLWLYQTDRKKQFGRPDHVVESLANELPGWVINGEGAEYGYEETYAVMDSASSQNIPQWFFDAYTSDGSLQTVDLDKLWVDFQYIQRNITYINRNLAEHLRTLFGGYCSDGEGYWALNNDGASNPWVEGGCANWRPGQLTATAGGASELSVSWNAPLRSSSPSINAYVVQWKSGNQDYDTSRQAIVTNLNNLSHTITGLTTGVEYAIAVRAVKGTDSDGMNVYGPVSAVTATPSS